MRKRIAPVVITLLASAYLIVWGSAPAFLAGLGWIGNAVMLAAAGLIGVLAVNLVKRLRELSEEDEEELRKY